MPAPTSFRRQLLVVCGVIASLATLIALTSEPAWTDDRDLLRTNTATPYLFILLDNSASMTLKLGPVAGQDHVVGFGDGPGSRLYEAKAALHQVFNDDSLGANEVEYGFAAFNQDGARVIAKHWLYFTDVEPSWFSTFPYPAPDADGRLTTGPNAAGAYAPDVEGDAMVFGPWLTADGGDGEAGDCAAPIPLGTVGDRDRAKVNNFSTVLGLPGVGNSTVRWVSYSGSTYRVRTRPANAADEVGQDPIQVTFEIDRYDDCSGAATPIANETIALKLDPGVNEFLMVDYGAQDTSGQQDDEPEDNAGLWDHTDIVSNSSDEDDPAWTEAHPFTGKGWEGNYDSFCASVDTGSGNVTFDGFMTNDDVPNPPNPCTATDYNVKVDPTVFSSTGRSLDRGDMLPFDWTLADGVSRADFLRRLTPAASPDFGIAGYFNDVADGSGRLPALFRDVIFAEGQSPLAKAINDFRCWSLGGDENKCRNSSAPEGGWKDLACANDPDFGCRRVFLIVISDGEDTVGGESPVADVSDMGNSLLATKVWALNLGPVRGCTAAGVLHPLTQAGDGECVNVSNRTDLLNTLQDILGQIRSETRAFASAAVPSVQAEVEQALYVSNFTPTPPSQDTTVDPPVAAPRPGEDSVWDGHINAFLKPLPIDAVTGRPDTTRLCSALPPAQRAGCFLWDAGAELLTQVGTSPNFLGEAANLRRVFYSMEPTGNGTWTAGRRLFTATDNATAANTRYDLWRGLRFTFKNDTTAPAGVDTTTQDLANAVIDNTFEVNTHTFVDTVAGTPVTITNVLGDIFHSNPLIVGNPANTQYFAGDVGGDGVAGCATSPPDLGYRCFELKHRNRRKVLVVGANDGMLHAFDAGLPTIVTGTDPVTGASLPPRVQFDTGTGKEVWAYMPRSVLPVVHEQATGTGQLYSVDGTVNVADAFIDPVHAGTPTAGEREWRTVLVGGLREGGREISPPAGMAYYALDITQPDTLDTLPTDATLGQMPEPINGYVPSCVATSGTAVSGCGGMTYPAPLWEFADGAYDALGIPVYAGAADDPARFHVRLDEDNNQVGNGTADLSFTWSVPNIGRIRVCTGAICDPTASPNDIFDKYVAVFGGGLGSPKESATPTSGSWIYMVDIETGRAIYKRQVEGGVPAEPAAVDTNQDGYLDRIYFGTTAGLMYRVDLNAAPDGTVPALETVNVHGVDGVTYTAQRIVNEFGTSTPTWVPYAIFNANIDGLTGLNKVRPIYQRPSVIFVAKLGRFALAFGPGDREDLWSPDTLDATTTPPTTRPGRFFLFVDDTEDADLVANPLPWTEERFTRVLTNDVDLAGNPDLLETSARTHKGWYLVLNGNERVINNAFALSGIVSFSTFEPQIATTDEDGDPVPAGCSAGRGGGNQNELRFCSRLGRSRIFVTFTTNANSVLTDAGNAAIRYLQINTFVTEPYTEQGLNKNPNPGDTGANLDQLSARQIEVMNKLKTLFPPNCKFANHRIDIKAIAGDTGTVFIAPVPVCIVEKNWKEF
jgi:hypothetical protein